VSKMHRQHPLCCLTSSRSKFICWEAKFASFSSRTICSLADTSCRRRRLLRRRDPTQPRTGKKMAAATGRQTQSRKLRTSFRCRRSRITVFATFMDTDVPYLLQAGAVKNHLLLFKKACMMLSQPISLFSAVKQRDVRDKGPSGL
jgi:hypothetical protein